jgi:Transposase DDE domain
VDAQSVKNTDTAGFKGYDAGKKVSGIKRHIAVDTLGLPHAVAVTTAEVTDRKGALQALKHSKDTLGQRWQRAGRWRLHGPAVRARGARDPGRAGRSGAYFSPSWTAFQSDRGRCFSANVDDGGGAQVMF